MQALSARAVIELLGLQRHPEGGWYSETFRDPEGGKRGHSTAIYYLLERGDRSHWHRVIDASEIWHWHGGALLELSLSVDGQSLSSHLLGMDFAAGARPQCAVPAGCWQSARSLGDWSLVGCTVAPGFEYESFEIAPSGWHPADGQPNTIP